MSCRPWTWPDFRFIVVPSTGGTHDKARTRPRRFACVRFRTPPLKPNLISRARGVSISAAAMPPLIATRRDRSRSRSRTRHPRSASRRRLRKARARKRTSRGGDSVAGPGAATGRWRGETLVTEADSRCAWTVGHRAAVTSSRRQRQRDDRRVRGQRAARVLVRPAPRFTAPARTCYVRQ